MDSSSNRSDTEKSSKMDCESRRSNKMDLAFSGAGFMGCYYVGVIDCWRKYVPRNRVNRVSGASAGSLIAAYYLCDLPMSDCLRKIVTMSEEIRKRPLGVFDRRHQIVDELPMVLDEIFPVDAHKRVGNKLYVCMTRLKDMKKVMVNEFESRKDLIDALNCSCFIPVWSGNHVPTYKGVKHIDGGFTDCLPAFDERTIRVCSFSGDTDISPYDKIKPKVLSRSINNMPLYLNFANLRRGKKALSPMSAGQVMHLLDLGFLDTKNFILDNDLIQCDKCFNDTDPSEQPVYSRPSPCITPRRQVSPAMVRKANGPQNHHVTPTNNTNLLSPGDGVHDEFSKLLSATLRRRCSETGQFDASQDDAKNSIRIIVSEEKDSTQSSQAQGKAAAKNKNKTREFARRNTCPRLSPTLEEKFTGTLGPLPSCPPSPNLNRHCTECILMRQEARMDKLEEKIRAEVEKYIVVEAPGKSKIKMASPLRWLKKLKRRSSYDFPEPELVPVAG